MSPSHPRPVQENFIRAPGGKVKYWSTLCKHNLKSSVERLQIVSLKIILGSDCPMKEDGHFDYQRASTICNLKSIFSRREKKTLDFGIKCIKHPTLKKHFPTNPAILEDPYPVRDREQFHVNRARTCAYNTGV